MEYSEDFRKRALEYMDEGHTYEELYEAFNIYSSAIEDWRKLLSETGSLKPRYKKTHKRKIDKDKLYAAVKEKPDAYLHELAKQFDCTKQAVFYALKKLNLTYKKILHILGEIRRSKSRVFKHHFRYFTGESRLYRRMWS